MAAVVKAARARFLETDEIAIGAAELADAEAEALREFENAAPVHVLHSAGTGGRSEAPT